jgi:DNA-binding XRE family transcriptional regulator
MENSNNSIQLYWANGFPKPEDPEMKEFVEKYARQKGCKASLSAIVRGLILEANAQLDEPVDFEDMRSINREWVRVNLTRIRKSLKISQTELAKAAGVGMSTVQDAEAKRHNRVISVGNLKKIAKALSDLASAPVTVDMLLEEPRN